MSNTALGDIVQQVLGNQEVSQEEREWLLDKIGFDLDDIAHEHKESLNSPKLSDELERLNQITVLCKKLHRKLASLNELTRFLLDGNLERLQKPRRYKFLETVPAPVPAASIAREMMAQSGIEGMPPLMAMAKATEDCRSFLARNASSQSGTGVRRGAGNLHTHTHGNLRDLATHKLALFLGRYQGIDAVKTTQGGKLHRLATAAWEYVAGSGSGTADGEMEAVVKRVAPIARRVLKAEQQDEHGKGLNSHGFKMLGIDSEARRALRQPRPRKRATRPKGGISPKNGEMPP